MANTDNKLGTFLMKLSEDQQLHKEFVADPKATMAKNQLSAAEVHTVISKNSKAMSAALVGVIKDQKGKGGGGVAAAGGGSTDNTVVVVVVVVAMPGELNQ